VLPSVSPRAVRQQVTDFIVRPGYAVIGRQQIAPGSVTIGICIGCNGCAGNFAVPVSIGVFLARVAVGGGLIPPTVAILKGKSVTVGLENH